MFECCVFPMHINIDAAPCDASSADQAWNNRVNPRGYRSDRYSVSPFVHEQSVNIGVALCEGSSADQAWNNTRGRVSFREMFEGCVFPVRVCSCLLCI